MLMKKSLAFFLISTIALSACANDTHHMHHQTNHHMPHMHAAHHSMYHKGDHVTIMADHMDGMHGAHGTVRNVYDTYVYEVSFKPTTGGKMIKHHKWVVNEEIKDAPKTGFKKGDKVTLNADHMKGMKGAEATIDSVKKAPVYVVDYKPVNGGKMIRNHMWMTEEELTEEK